MTNIDSFDNVQFPLSISFGATGGPEFRNEIVQMTSGFEQRNARFSKSLHLYDAGTGVRSKRDLYQVLAFFEARHGSLIGFRFRDPFDSRSSQEGQMITPSDQILGIGNGEQSSFALTKTYFAAQQMPSRRIVLPVVETVEVALNGTLTTDWSLDETTGSIVFSEPIEAGVVVSAGFEFDVPVRFDTEQLVLSVATFEAGSIPSIPLKEVRL